VTFALVIHPDGRIEDWAERPTDLLDALQAACGGDVQTTPPLEHGATGWVNEDGIALGLPRNDPGSELMERVPHLPGDYVKGTMVVTGDADDEGETTAIPAAMAAMILGMDVTA
jgi:hypothetical protein